MKQTINQIKTIIVLVLVLIGILNTACTEKDKSKHNNSQAINEDSLTKVMLSQSDSLIQEFSSRKPDTNDSAWINDFKGNTVWNSRSQSLEGKPIILTDTLTKNYYVLDSSHSKITAFNSSREFIWETNPYKEGKITDYRYKIPTVYNLHIGPNKRQGNGETVLHVSYNNSQFGYIELNSGKFIFSGQD